MASVVTGAMGTLLPKLANLITEEYNLHKRVRGEIMFLKAEIESMETALLKVSEAPIDKPPDIQVKLWAKHVRDLSYDLEDSIDKFIVRIETHGQPEKSHSFRNFIDKSLSLLTKGKIRHKIGIDIKDIRSRIKEVSEQRDRYKVDSVGVDKPTGPTIDTLRLSALYRKATELVGTNQKSVEVIKMLMEGDEVSNRQLEVVSIVGFGGLGKTTLANAVYEKLKVQVDIQTKKLQFNCAAFVSVSLNPNMLTIFKSLLHQLDKQTYQNINEATWGEAQLIQEIRTFLKDKRYLIVIDDVWNKSIWESIKYALNENEKGSRVIVTTRILDVAHQAGDVYRLEPLSDVDSRKLFYQRIYETKNKSPPNQLVEVSEKILKRCAGVPLAILTIGSLLSSKNKRAHTHEYWSKVYKSISSGLESNDDEVKNMRRILSVSYSVLAPHLKTCMLYLSLYAEDHEIETAQLIWKWVGEGFVKKEHGRSLYGVGEDYLDELINNGLVQPVRFKEVNKVLSCRIHDMVRDLITFISNEESFLTIVGCQWLECPPSKIRRLSVQGRNEEVTYQLATMSFSHVRSLTVSLAFSLLPALFRFPVLRVLDLTYCKEVDNKHWKDICNLFHLRYLSLRGTSITKVPKEIVNLHFLQVMDIRSTKIDEELPSTFIQLTQLLLVHMLNSIVCGVPRWMRSMKFLFSLSITLKTPGQEDLQVLGSIPCLSELYIQVKKSTQDGEKRMVVDSGCPFLCLTRFSVTSDTMGFMFSQGAMQSLQNLWLEFNENGTWSQHGDFIFGLENLYSLEYVNINSKGHGYLSKGINKMRNAVVKEIKLNPNKPKLVFTPTTTPQDLVRVSAREFELRDPIIGWRKDKYGRTQDPLLRFSASNGGLFLVGCIPYRKRDDGELEVLVINSQKGNGMRFPRGEWSMAESMEEAAKRHAFQEAGVRGNTGAMLGRWICRSSDYVQGYEGLMFPFHVTYECEWWPEMTSRKRTWATTQQAMDGFKHWWMREMLEWLVPRHAEAA